MMYWVGCCRCGFVLRAAPGDWTSCPQTDLSTSRYWRCAGALVRLLNEDQLAADAAVLVGGLDAAATIWAARRAGTL